MTKQTRRKRWTCPCIRCGNDFSTEYPRSQFGPPDAHRYHDEDHRVSDYYHYYRVTRHADITIRNGCIVHATMVNSLITEGNFPMASGSWTQSKILHSDTTECRCPVDRLVGSFEKVLRCPTAGGRL